MPRTVTTVALNRNLIINAHHTMPNWLSWWHFAHFPKLNTIGQSWTQSDKIRLLRNYFHMSEGSRISKQTCWKGEDDDLPKTFTSCSIVGWMETVFKWRADKRWLFEKCWVVSGWVGGSVKFIKTLAINPVFQGKLVISQEPHNPLGTDAIGHVNLEHFTRRKDI